MIGFATDLIETKLKRSLEEAIVAVGADWLSPKLRVLVLRCLATGKINMSHVQTQVVVITRFVFQVSR